MIFVDTGAWFAMTVPSDQDHDAVERCFAQISEPLFTTDYIIDETLTLLRARGYGHRALLLGEAFFNGSLADVHHLDESEIKAAWEVFRQYDDKEWSFTDCASKVAIEEFRITQAISLDHHFRQFGGVQVMP